MSKFMELVRRLRPRTRYYDGGLIIPPLKIPMPGERVEGFPAEMFDKARCYPQGGIVGLKPGQVPVILNTDYPLNAKRVRKKEWTRYFMGFAEHAATMSKDSTKVGAVLVGPENEIRLTGYNGIPRGVADLAERRERPDKYLFASHAEANLIAFAAREGIRTSGCTVYTTHQPCAACSRTLIQAGIKRIIYGTGSFGEGSTMPEEMEAAKIMLSEAGIVCEALLL